LYFELLAILALVTFTLSVKHDDKYIESLRNLFICEQMGHNPENPCSQSDANKQGYPYINLLSYIILGFFPVVILVYAITMDDLTKTLEFVKVKLKKLK